MIPVYSRIKPTVLGRILMIKLWVGLCAGHATQPYLSSQSQHGMDHY